MKKANRKILDDIRPEYDFGAMKGGIRGKYVKRYRAGTNLILLGPDLAKVFPNEAAVNGALRAVLRLTESVRLPRIGRTPHEPARGSFAGRWHPHPVRKNIFFGQGAPPCWPWDRGENLRESA